MNSEVLPPVSGKFDPIDIKGLVRSIGLADKGAARGKSELPSTSDTTLDLVEQEVVGRISAELTLQSNYVAGVLRFYREQLAQLRIASVMGSARLAADRTGGAFHQIKREMSGQLGMLERDLAATASELAEFRHRHRLTRPARISAHRWTTIALLLPMTVIESLANGVFFAKGSDYGLIGGFATAVGISAVNIFFAFLIGLSVLRGTNHRRVLIRLISWMVFLAGVAALLGLHLFAAHFRDAIGNFGEAGAYAEAIRSLQSNPVGLTDIASWYMFGLGAAFALVSTWKGYTHDDPYPGYGPIVRRWAASEEDYREAHDEFFERAEGARDDALKEIKNALDRVPVHASQAEAIRASRNALLERFRSHEVHLEESANRLLEIYRDANRRHRTTPPPAHFATRWGFGGSVLDRPEFIALRADPDEEKRVDVEALMSELRSLTQSVIRGYNELIAGVKHPHEFENTEEAGKR